MSCLIVFLIEIDTRSVLHYVYFSYKNTNLSTISVIYLSIGIFSYIRKKIISYVVLPRVYI